MPIKPGSALYVFRWYWRQDIGTQIFYPPSGVVPVSKSHAAIKKT